MYDVCLNIITSVYIHRNEWICVVGNHRCRGCKQTQTNQCGRLLLVGAGTKAGHNHRKTLRLAIWPTKKCKLHDSLPSKHKLDSNVKYAILCVQNYQKIAFETRENQHKTHPLASRNQSSKTPLFAKVGLDM